LGYVFGGTEPRKFPLATIAIVVINVVVYLITSSANYLISSSSSYLYKLGFIPALLPSPEGLARIFTSMFVHANLLHLVFNMYFLYIFGRGVEDVMGSRRFLVLYLLSGIGASLFHTAAVPVAGLAAIGIPAVGASGAISGVLGAYLMFFPGTSLVACFPIFFLPACFTMRASAYLIFWFATQVIYGYMNLGGIAFFAHAGGFIAGIALAWILGRVKARELRIFRETLYLFRYIVLRVYVSGLGRAAKILLIALIALSTAPLIYYSATIEPSSLSVYVGNVGFDGYVDTVLLKVSPYGSYSYEGYNYDNTNIILYRISKLNLLVNPSLSGRNLSYLDKPLEATVEIRLEVGNRYVSEKVPVTLYFEAIYDENGVIKSAEGVMQTEVVQVSVLLGRTMVSKIPVTLRFSIAFSDPYTAEAVVIALPPSALISLVAIYVVARKDTELVIS